MSISATTDVAIEPARGPAVEHPVSSPAAAPAIARHPLLGVAIVTLVALAVATFGLTVHALVVAFAATTLAVLAAIDIEHRVLPNRIVLPAAVIVALAQVAVFPDDALAWLLAGPAAAAFLALPLIVRRDAVGLGDVKLALLLGACVGWRVFGAIVIGCIAMLPVALLMLGRDGSIRNAKVPFGPFLALGTLLIMYTS